MKQEIHLPLSQVKNHLLSSVHWCWHNGSSFSIIKVFSPQILWAFIFAQRAIKRNSILHKESLLNDWRASKARKPKEYHTYGELSMHGLTEIFKLPVILHALINDFWFPTNQETIQLPLIFKQQIKLKKAGTFCYGE